MLAAGDEAKDAVESELVASCSLSMETFRWESTRDAVSTSWHRMSTFGRGDVNFRLVNATQHTEIDQSGCQGDAASIEWRWTLSARAGDARRRDAARERYMDTCKLHS
eukprot:754191-Hanusia_phi.AAC.19